MTVITSFLDVVAGVSILAGRSSLLDTSVFKTANSSFSIRQLLAVGFIGVGGWNLWNVQKAQNKLKKTLGAESFSAESGQMCEVCFGNDDLPYDSDHFTDCGRCEKSVCMDCDGEMESHPDWFKVCGECNTVLENVSIHGAESFAAYEDPISDRQRYRISKLGGRIEKSMNRSDASRYIKSLMADPLHAETQALDCSACQGWGWNEDLNVVCDADGCIGGWVVPKKPSLLERGLELGAGVGLGVASVAIVFGILGGTVGLAAEELKKRRD